MSYKQGMGCDWFGESVWHFLIGPGLEVVGIYPSEMKVLSEEGKLREFVTSGLTRKEQLTALSQ